jgi:hypothetical protein
VPGDPLELPIETGRRPTDCIPEKLDGRASNPTGDYHGALAYLLAKGIEVVSISFFALAKVREARFGTWIRMIPKTRRLFFAVPRYGSDVLRSADRRRSRPVEVANTYFQITPPPEPISCPRLRRGNENINARYGRPPLDVSPMAVMERALLASSISKVYGLTE